MPAAPIGKTVSAATLPPENAGRASSALPRHAGGCARRGGTRAGPAVCAFSGLRNNVFPCAGASLYAPVACASFSAGAAASAWTAGDVYAALALSG